MTIHYRINSEPFDLIVLRPTKQTLACATSYGEIDLIRSSSNFKVKDPLTTLNQVSLINSFFVDLYSKEILFLNG